jgi:hypothetical protein
MREIRDVEKNTEAPVVSRGYKIILDAVRTSIIIHAIGEINSGSFSIREKTGEDSRSGCSM